MEALIASSTELRGPDLPEYEPDEVVVRRRPHTTFYKVLDALRPHAAAAAS